MMKKGTMKTNMTEKSMRETNMMEASMTGRSMREINEKETNMTEMSMKKMGNTAACRNLVLSTTGVWHCTKAAYTTNVQMNNLIQQRL